MTKTEIIKAARESLQADSRRPGRVRFAEMVSQGVIDAGGNVLLRGPGDVSNQEIVSPSDLPPVSYVLRRPRLRISSTHRKILTKMRLARRK